MARSAKKRAGKEPAHQRGNRQRLGKELKNFLGLRFEVIAHLAESGGFELSHAFFRKPKLITKAFKRARGITQLALADNETLAFVQGGHRLDQPGAQRFDVLLMLDARGLLRIFVLKRLNPLASLVIRGLRCIERKIGARQAALHHFNIMKRNADFG